MLQLHDCVVGLHVSRLTYIKRGAPRTPKSKPVSARDEETTKALLGGDVEEERSGGASLDDHQLAGGGVDVWPLLVRVATRLL